MSDLMKWILEEKAKNRKRLAALPFAEKLRMLEMMRERSLLLAQNPLRKRKDKKEVG